MGHRPAGSLNVSFNFIVEFLTGRLSLHNHNVRLPHRGFPQAHPCRQAAELALPWFFCSLSEEQEINTIPHNTARIQNILFIVCLYFLIQSVVLFLHFHRAQVRRRPRRFPCCSAATSRRRLLCAWCCSRFNCRPQGWQPFVEMATIDYLFGLTPFRFSHFKPLFPTWEESLQPTHRFIKLLICSDNRKS